MKHPADSTLTDQRGTPSVSGEVARQFTRRTFRLSLLIALVVLATVGSIRFLTLFPFAPNDLVREDLPQPVDAVLILEGAPERIDYAFSLIRDGYTDTVLYPGLHEWSRRYLERRTQETGAPYTLYSLTATEGTYDEALNSLRLLRSHPNITSLMLVTSTYHSHRAQWIFRRVLPRHVSIISTPIQEDWWSPERARRAGSGARLTYRREQYKFAGYFLLYGWRLFI